MGMARVWTSNLQENRCFGFIQICLYPHI